MRQPMIRKIDCSPRAIIGPSEKFTVLRHHSGRTADIIDTIIYADERSSSYILPGVQCLAGRTDRDTLRNVWAFIRNNLTYRADRPGHERVKSPGALFAEGVGDCKSYSIATGAILRSLGIPYKYRFTSYEPGDVTHVYVVADTADGPVLLDSVHTRFDEEVPYYRKKDIRPDHQRAAVAGLPRMNDNHTGADISFTLKPWLVAVLAVILGKFLLQK